jgi:GMP synthase (glutamine-hydrolysing)
MPSTPQAKTPEPSLGSTTTAHQTIVILDFGSQFTQLIARRVRAANVLSVILPGDADIDRIRAVRPRGVILSGGPASVYADGAPQADARVLDLGVPILGVCYGLQMLMCLLGGDVRDAQEREYGKATLRRQASSPLLEEWSDTETVWMSHGDSVASLPQGFDVVATTNDCGFAVVQDLDRRVFGIQFHPEVAHTPRGDLLLRNFLLRVCECRQDWTAQNFVEESIKSIRQRVGSRRVLAAVSGGVDSTVLATLVHRALPGQVETLFVDNGLLRLDEVEEVVERFHRLGIDLQVLSASDRFLEALRGVTDPEAKRKAIGRTFIRVFEEGVRHLDPVHFLAQGTLYPDVIESSVHGGHSKTIKTHHNVGGLPEDLQFELLEPLRDLFKDEVRAIGVELGIDADSLGRHPFPGPGLAVRVLGEVTRERLDILRDCDALFIRALQRHGWYDRTWQALAVLLPVNSVGVMGDGRTYENVLALRAVDSVDGMTADWTRLPQDLLAEVANDIINRVRGVNRVVYDISSKPPSTIEWE